MSSKLGERSGQEARAIKDSLAEQLRKDYPDPALGIPRIRIAQFVREQEDAVFKTVAYNFMGIEKRVPFDPSAIGLDYEKGTIVKQYGTDERGPVFWLKDGPALTDWIPWGGTGSGTNDHTQLINRSAPEQHPASSISTVTTNFNNNLSALDVDVQHALDTLDDLDMTGDGKVKVTISDIKEYLDDKITAGTGIIKSVYQKDPTHQAIRLEVDQTDIGKVKVISQDYLEYLDDKVLVGAGLKKTVISKNGTPVKALQITLDDSITNPEAGGALYTCRTVTPGTPSVTTTPNVIDTNSISYTLNYNDSRLSYYGASVDIPLIHFANDPTFIVTGVRMTVNTPFNGGGITEFKVRLDLDSRFEWDNINNFGSNIYNSPIPSSSCGPLLAEEPLVDIAGVSPGTVYNSVSTFKQEFSDSSDPDFAINPLWIIIESNGIIANLTQGSLTVEVFYEQRDVTSLQRLDATYLVAHNGPTVTSATYPLITSSAGNGALPPPTSWIYPAAGRKLTRLIATVAEPFTLISDDVLIPGATISYTVTDSVGNVIIPPTDCTYSVGAPRFASITTGLLDIDFSTAPLNVTFNITGATLSNVSSGHIIFDPLYETTTSPAPTVTGYKLLTASQLSAEGADVDTVGIDANISSPGEVAVVLSFSTLVGTPGVTSLPVGTWTFNVYGYVDGTTAGVTNSWRVKMAVWRDGQPGPDAPFLTATSGNISHTVPQITTFTAAQGSPIAVTTNDRLVAVYYGVTDGSVLRTFTLVYNDISRNNSIVTPIAFMGGTGTIVHNTTTLRDAAACHPASSVTADTTNFNNNLTSAEDTVQKALDKLDGITIFGGSGTAGYLPKWSTSTSLGDSGVTDDGTSITILGTRNLKLNGATSGYVALKSPASPTSWTLTLPTTAGTADYVLKTDGAGTTSWVSISSLGGVLTTRTINTTNGLQGGGDLSADRTLSPVYGSTANTVCQGNDSRLSDDRTASGIRTATTVVSVSGATAPSSGQVIRATSSTNATWQTLTPADIGALPAANINVTQNYLAKGGASAGTLTNSIIRDDGTRASIGTAPGSALFSISTSGTADNLRLNGSGAGTPGFQLALDDTIRGYFALARYTGNFFTDANPQDMNFRSEADSIRFGSGSAESTLVVHSTKKVGVGTGLAAPLRKLEVVLGASSAISPLTNMSDLGNAYMAIHPGTAYGDLNTSHGIMARSDVTSGIALGGMVWRRFGAVWESALDFYTHPSGTSSVNEIRRALSLTQSSAQFFEPVEATSLKLNGSTSGAVTYGVAATTASYTMLAPSTAPADGQTIVYPAGGGQGTWATISGGVSGSGTTNSLAKWTGSTALGDSGITDDGSLVGLASTRTLYVSSGVLQLGANGLTNSSLRMRGSTSGTVTIQTAAAAGTWSLTLPTTAGTSNYVLYTNGSGVTSWGSLAGLGAVTGSGTVNYMPRWTPSGTVLGNSGITDDGNATIQVISTRTFTVISGQLASGVNGTAGGTLQLRGLSSGTVTVQTAAAAGTWSLTLPTTDGNSNEVLYTNGSGVTSWASISSLGGVTGSGTTGVLTKWTGSGTIGDSLITESSTLLSAAARVTASYNIRTTGYSAFSSGSGIEMYYNEGVGSIAAYNYTGASWLPMSFGASSYSFNTGAVSCTSTVTAANLTTTTNTKLGHYSAANAVTTSVSGTYNTALGNGISIGSSATYCLALGETSSIGTSSYDCVAILGSVSDSVSLSIAIHTANLAANYTMKVGYKNIVTFNNSSGSNWLFMATPMSSNTGATLAGDLTCWLPIAMKPDSVAFGCLALGNYNSCWGHYDVFFQPW